MRKKIVPEKLVKDFVDTWNKMTVDDGDWASSLERSEINFGWCYQLAILLRKYHGPKAQLWFNHYHCWIEIDGVHYDTDHPEGTTLDTMAVDEPPVMRRASITATADAWCEGGSGEVNLDVIEAILKKNGFRKRNNRRNKKAA